MNDGDSITYSKKGGVQTISLTSNANAGISGSVLSNDDADIDGDANGAVDVDDGGNEAIPYGNVGHSVQGGRCARNPGRVRS